MGGFTPSVPTATAFAVTVPPWLTALNEDRRAWFQFGSLAELVGQDRRGRRHEDDLLAALVGHDDLLRAPDPAALDTVPLVIALLTVVAPLTVLTVPFVIALGAVPAPESVVSGMRSQA